MADPRGSKAKSGGFQSLGLSKDVFRAVMKMGYKVPTPIQRKTLPLALAGRDVVAMARTGSGKTAVFLIPLIERLQNHSTRIGSRALVLAPTRELAIQTLRFTKQLAKFTDLKTALIVGGESMDQQFDSLSGNPDIIIATPGRLRHHLDEVPDFSLKSVEFLVFDEADRLFEMGFAEQINDILRGIPETRQTLLFSATMPKALVSFARAGLSDPELIRLDTDTKISDQLRLAFFTVRSGDKLSSLIYLVREVIPRDDLTIIFASTKHHVELIHEILNAINIESAPVYGDMDQSARKINLAKFRTKKCTVLIVTDVAARGLDVPLLNNVVNFSFPASSKLFVHRVGRAARAGRSGTAFSFVEPDEIPYMIDLYLFLGRKLLNQYHSSEIESEEKGHHLNGYELADMTPEYVHYGTFPQNVVDAENETLRRLLSLHNTMEPLIRVCENATKQYNRTRADPSNQSIKRAKELPGGKIHPLLLGFAGNAEAQRNDYVAVLKSFRPSATIFEVAAGPSGKAGRDAKKLEIMKEKRKHHDTVITHRKKEKGDIDVSSAEKHESRTDRETDGSDRNDFNSALFQDSTQKSLTPAGSGKEKVYLSKALRKKLKKGQVSKVTVLEQASTVSKKPEERKESFKDTDHYISHIKEKDRATEDQLQLNDNSKASLSSRLEDATLDLVPEDVRDMSEKKRIMHWDKRKRKFVQMTVGELKAGGSGKRLKTESGGRGKEHKKGEIYKKWQERNHKRIERGGADEEGAPDEGDLFAQRQLKQREMPNAKLKDELKSAAIIRKEKAKKEKLREKHGRKPRKAGGGKGKR